MNFAAHDNFVIHYTCYEILSSAEHVRTKVKLLSLYRLSQMENVFSVGRGAALTLEKERKEIRRL